MPLTPADVHNVAFSKPPIGKRGYNEDEVDAFLDLVENELTRLIEENSDLRQRIEELDRELGGGAAAPTQAIRTFEPEPEPEPVKPAPAPVAAPVAAGTNEELAMRAARVLTLAQDTADRLTGTAKAESEKMMADARANADQILTEARQTAETTVTEARQRADAMLADAQSRSETQLRQARRRPTPCRPTRSASTPRSWEPLTSSAPCWKAASSSCVPSNASTAPDSRPTWNLSSKSSASAGRRRPSTPAPKPVGSTNSIGVITSLEQCRARWASSSRTGRRSPARWLEDDRC